MSIVVQKRSTFATGVTTLALAYTSNNAANNLLIYSYAGGGTITAATDSNTNTIALAKAVSGGGNVRVDYVASSNAGANTVTGHQSVSDFHAHIREISGCVTATPLDQTGSVGSSATGKVSTDGITSQPGEITFATFLDATNSQALTRDGSSDESELTSVSGFDCCLTETKIVFYAGIKTLTCLGNGADALWQVIATFKAIVTVAPVVGNPQRVALQQRMN